MRLGRRFCGRGLVVHCRQGLARRITSDLADIARRLKSNHHIVNRAVGSSAGQATIWCCRGIKLVVGATSRTGRSRSRKGVTALASPAAVSGQNVIDETSRGDGWTAGLRPTQRSVVERETDSLIAGEVSSFGHVDRLNGSSRRGVDVGIASPQQIRDGDRSDNQNDRYHDQQLDK